MEVEQSGHRWEVPAARRLPRRGTDRMGDAVAWLLVSLALLVAVLAILAGRAALGAVWWGVRRWIGLRNAELWARGWERVEPQWTGRAR